MERAGGRLEATTPPSPDANAPMPLFTPDKNFCSFGLTLSYPTK